MSVSVYPYRGSGLGVLVIAGVVLNGGPALFNRFMSHGLSDYAVHVWPKVVTYGTASILTVLLTLFLTPVFGKDDKTSSFSRLMRDHFFYIPVALWPLVFMILCYFSVRTHFLY